MKLYKVFMIVLMTSAFAVVGCGDSGGESACAPCETETLRDACEIDYNECIQGGGSQDRCAELARADCLL